MKVTYFAMILLSAVLLVFVYFYSGKLWQPFIARRRWTSGYETAFARGSLSDDGIYEAQEEDNRCNQLLDWKTLIQPCLYDMEWIPITERNRSIRTSAKQSVIKGLTHGLTGVPVSFVIETRTANGDLKKVGGDFWRAYVRGPMNMEVYVADLMDGTYAVGFTPLVSGSFTVKVTLAFSTCDGIRDQPKDWFTKGNVQGKFQENGMLGQLDDFLNEAKEPFSIFIGKRNETISSPHCKQHCTTIWYPDGYWSQDKTWHSHIRVNESYNQHGNGNGALWLVGDSVTGQFYKTLLKHSMCRTVFHECINTYGWNYRLQNQFKYNRHSWDAKDFRATEHLKMYHEVLLDVRMRNNQSALVMNYGLHAVSSLPFATYKNIIGAIIDIVKHYRKKYGRESPTIIWKSTTSTHREKMPHAYNTALRFLTDQIIRLFNAYANAEMCKNGIGILDVYPITSSYPDGPINQAHYLDKVVLRPAQIGLQRHLEGRETMLQ